MRLAGFERIVLIVYSEHVSLILLELMRWCRFFNGIAVCGRTVTLSATKCSVNMTSVMHCMHNVIGSRYMDSIYPPWIICHQNFFNWRNKNQLHYEMVAKEEWRKDIIPSNLQVFLIETQKAKALTYLKSKKALHT